MGRPPPSGVISSVSVQFVTSKNRFNVPGEEYKHWQDSSAKHRECLQLSGFQDGFSEGKLGGTIKIRVETQVQTDLTFQDIKVVHHFFHDFSTGRMRNHFLLWSKPREALEIAEIYRCSSPQKNMVCHRVLIPRKFLQKD